MMTRRGFLTHSCSLGIASTTLSSCLLQLGLARSAAAQSATGYKALVCVLLAGGNDSFNMLVPTDNDQYGEYQGIRSDLALPQSSLLALPGTASNGRNYGLHPGMAELQSLFANGDAAMIANVGTLLEAFDLQAFTSGSARLPLGLFSHADQISQWQTARPDARVAQGWAGRIADLMQDVNVMNGVSMNISLSGSNVFQSGNQVGEYSIDATGDGAPGVNAYDDGTDFGALRKRMVDELLAVQQQNIFRREYSQRLRRAIDAQSVFVDALQSSPTLTTEFSPGNFSQSLRQIARVIGARDALGATRQTFFVTVGGWDHHDDVIENQAGMLPAISKGLQEFRDALNELGVFDDVTTFTTSDFGRTLTSNGKGSDHGWGGHHIVMGGAVNGGSIYGDYPILSPSSPLDVGRGVYAPTTSVDEYFAELARWFGVPASELDQVLPNVRTFYSPESSAPPIGFMAA
ncbi:MAG: DUF1501 domain-containing protein [Gammaproteobacteria bacterium]|nr:DUF1501 domain-containing protein [Gammaproteobacteria bacterium]